jgi:phage-related protein
LSTDNLVTKLLLDNICPFGYITIMKIEYYTTSSGRKPVVDYIRMQPKIDKAGLIEALDMIETYGFNAPRVNFRHIRGKLWEIKIERNLSHRIFYVSVDKDEIVLLHGYLKKSQKAPDNEIKLAEKRMKERLSRGGY